MPTTPPPVTPLPDPPSRGDPANFVARADAFLGALPDLQDDLDAVADNAYDNAVAAQASAVASQASAVNSQASATLSAAQVPLATAQAVAAAASAASAVAAPSTSATSTTSLTPGTGSKVFTTQSGKAFAAGQTVVARSAGEPRQWMVGVVTSYVGTSLSITATMFGQAPAAGTSADWNITFWGAVPSAAKPGQLLRLNGSTPEWGDEGGEPVLIVTAENLHTQSASIPTGGAGGTATDSVAIASDGTLTAGELNAPIGSSRGLTISGFSAGEFVAYSREYKAGSLGFVDHIIFATTEGAYFGATLNLATGQVAASPGSEFVPTFVESKGNGWWRVTCIVPVRVSQNMYFYFAVLGTGSVQVGRAQVRRGRSPGLYVPTTTTAASGAGARKRNLVAYGKGVDTSSGEWFAGDGLVRVGSTISPAGDLTATRYSASSLNNYLLTAYNLDVNTQHTFSVWLRRESGTNDLLQRVTAIHDGTEDLVEAQLSSQWKRFQVTFVVGANPYVLLVPISYPGSGLIDVWGAQLEKGPRASNFIDSGAGATDGQHADIEARRTHLVDTTYAAVDIAPPEGMQPGDWFEVVDVGGVAASNNITILRGGIPLINGVAEDFVIDVNKWSGRFTMDSEKGLVIT